MNTEKFLVLAFLLSFLSASLCMNKPKVQLKYFVNFTNKENSPGIIQDLETLFILEEMAESSYRNLHLQRILPDSFKEIKEAKEQKNIKEISIDKETIKDLLTSILYDDGHIEFWKFPDGKIVDLNVKLFDKSGKYIFIEGPILNIAREAKLTDQKPDVMQIPHDSEETPASSRCLIQ